jgi:pathogenesis-related protein 1
MSLRSMCIPVVGACLVGVFVLVALSEQSPGQAVAPTGSAITPQEVADLIALHTRARQEVGVEPIKWSPELAGYAQAWADELVRRGTMEHRPREGPFAEKYGENLAIFSRGVTGEQQGATLWYDEKPNYTPGTPFDPEAGAGHYTQMVWRKSTEFGAGKAQFRSGPYKGMWILVGNYNPAGNNGALQPDGKIIWEKPY